MLRLAFGFGNDTSAYLFLIYWKRVVMGLYGFLLCLLFVLLAIVKFLRLSMFVVD